MAQVTSEVVNTFINGRDPMERIVSVECGYQDDKVSIIYINENGEKRVRKEDFKPFAWVKKSGAIKLFDGNRSLLKAKLREYNIGIKTLDIGSDDEKIINNERIINGFKFLFYAKHKMTFTRFQRFFEEAKLPIYEKQSKKKEKTPSTDKEIMAVSSVEQFLISSGKRLFKGYENYNDLLRLTFDLETQGLNPQYHRIEQIGIHTNRGYDKIISIIGETEGEKDKNEADAIETMVAIMSFLKPDVVCGHNSENFDWDFVIVRYEKLTGESFSDMTLKYFAHPIYKKKKDAVLKLGGEVEYYKPTVMWGHSVLDSLHAARRAQAIDSSMKSSNLKYVTKYLNLNKPNRVYVPGDKITKTWAITDENAFAFNDNDGDWYQISDKSPLKDGYTTKSGRYIVERYLLDDIWETDKVEEKLNESNFLVSKMLPTSFTRACTMGTAGIWKLIILAWYYEQNLVVPATVPSKTFTGGLSRLLKTGYIPNVVKLDYNSLYPSIILTWNILSEVDATHVLPSLLNYVLTQREKYKGLKAEAGAKADKLKEKLKDENLTEKEKNKLKEEIQYWKSEKTGNDKKQLPLKILGNSMFGSFGSTNLFPLGSTDAAEMTTCIGRMCLRLMISHFKKLHYEPIVGDSFTADTPIFVKTETKGKAYINILPISNLFNEKLSKTDALGREYDTSKKKYKVLCRSGWMEPQYIYRHKTNKDMYEVTEKSKNMSINVTKDHSLYDENHNKINPEELNENSKLEYYENTANIYNFISCNSMNKFLIKSCADLINVQGENDSIIYELLNMDIENTKYLISLLNIKELLISNNKTVIAKINYLINKVKANE